MARRNKQDNDDASEENQDNLNNENTDDTFGLPEVEYEPIKRDERVEEPQPPVEEPVYEETEETREELVHSEEVYDEPHGQEEHQEYQSRYAYMEENNQSVWPKVLAILLTLIVVGGAIYYFAYYQPAQEKEKKERLAREAEQTRARDAQRAREAEAKRLADEAAQRRADSLANIQKEGSIEMLSGRTGQYWIVVASAIDDDLLMDFAQKLSKDGKQVKIIPPFGKQGKFHRLAIEARDNYADAQAAADNMKGGEFGDQLWVVKY